MTAPLTLTINLPPTFSGSFWSQPYRRGLHSLYGALQRGIDENSSLLALVEHRASLEYAHAEALAAPTPSPNLPTPLFKAARNAEKPITSITHAFRIIEREALGAQSNAHAKVAGNLDRNILGPFGRWSDEHERRVRSSWDHVDAVLERYESQQAEVERQRATYESKCRSADEAEDDARFAGGEVLSPSPSHSSTFGSQQHAAAPSEASSAETKATSRDASTDASSEQAAPEPPAKLDPERLKRRETLRDQFGFRRAPRNKPEAGADRYTSVSLSPRAASAQLPGDAAAGSEAETLSTRAVSAGSTESMKRTAGGITSTLSAALSRASEAPAIVSLRGALGGLNEPRHVRLRREAEHAEEAYRTGVRALDRERLRVEETLMDHYTYAESWEGERSRACRTVLLAYNAAFMPLLPQLDQSLSRTRSLEPSVSPSQSLAQVLSTSCTGAYLPLPEVFHPYYNGESTSLAGAGIASFGSDLVAYSRAETLAHEDAEGDDASGAIRAGVGKKGSLPALPLALSALLAALERAYDDASRWPAPASKEGEAKASTSEAALYANSEKRKAWVYDVPLVQSHACREQIIAHITSSRNPGAEAGAGLDTLLARFDAPTLAATVKLWALELTDSLVSRDLWDAVNSTYAAAAAQEQEAKAKAAPADEAKEKESDKAEEGKGDDGAATPKLDKGKGRVGLEPALEEKIRKGILADLSVVLGRLHKLHLVCLDAIVGHLARFMKKTSTNEPDPVYLNKLGLALGRALIRAPRQTSAALLSRAPVLLTMDLVGHYDALFPELLARKAHESEAALAQQRRTPIRKRTKPVDVRTTRRNLNASAGNEPVPVLPPKQERLAPGANAPMTASPTHTEAPPLPVAKPEQPKIVTDGPKAQQAEEEAPTPLADRVLGGAPASAAPAPASAGDKLSAADAGAAIERPGSSTSTSSAYATPPSEKADGPIASEGPKPSASGSNVARLSRQFGSTGSGSGARSAVRGARPMGARAAHGANRESRDLAPSVEETGNAPTRSLSERRRSWSRTMELSDKDLVAGDDVDE